MHVVCLGSKTVKRLKLCVVPYYLRYEIAQVVNVCPEAAEEANVYFHSLLIFTQWAFVHIQWSLYKHSFFHWKVLN
uniref:Ovule protein n=1 Tax=Angiostrongylus cantonensis TaxID=6313 RepID=A0A0K0CW82_ANGCA